MLEIPSILPDLFCKYTRHYVTYHILFSHSDSEIPHEHGELCILVIVEVLFGYVCIVICI